MSGQHGKSIRITEKLVSAYDYGNGNSYLRCQALVSDSDMQQTLTSDVLTVVLPRKQAEPSQNEESSETVETGENTDPTQPEATDPTGEPTSENTQPAEEPEDTGTTAGLSDETTGNVTSPTGAEKTGEEDKKDEPAEDEGEPVKGQLLEPLVPDGEKEGEEGDLPLIRGMLLEPLMRGTADISITFDLDGGIGVDNMTGLTSGDSQVIGTPTKSGYVFKGWTLTSPEGLADDVVTELQDSADNGNITVPEYSVAFKATWEAVQYVEPTFTTTKYTIEYWLDDPETGEYPDEPYHVTIVNNIEPNTTVSLSTDQKTFPDSTLKKYSHTSSIDAGPKQINANGTTVFKLKFKRNTYSFKFDMYSYFNNASFSTVPTLFGNSAYYTNNKNNMYTVTARYGQVISDQWPNSGDYNNPVRRGTTYYYQYVKIDNLSKFYSGNPRRVTSSLIPSTKNADGSEITCYVQYSNSSSTPHQVYHYKQKLDGTYEEAAHYYGSTTESVNVGISFEGFNNNKDKNYDTGNNSAKTYYKYYDRKSYNFYVVYPDGYTTSTSYVFEQSIGQPTPDYGSDQYSFIGWYSDPEFQNKIEDTEWANMTMPAHDLSVYAKWSQSTEIKTVNVYTYKDDNNALQGALTPITTTTGTPAKPSSEVQNRSREGYRFVRWVNNATSETFVFNQTVVNSDITVYGEWENAIVNYTVNFYLDKGNMTGTPHHSETVEKDGTVGSFAAPGRTGYDFLGWYYGEGEGKTPFRFTGDSNPTVITSDMNVYAEWTPKNYTLTIRYNDGVTEDYVQTVAFGTLLSDMKPTDPDSKEGYTFTGWTFDYDSLTWNSNMPDDDVVVNAQWQINEYKVEFYRYSNLHDIITIDHFSNPKTFLTVNYNETVSLDSYSTDFGPLIKLDDDNGKEFAGWFYNDSQGTPQPFTSGVTPVKSDLKLYATWANKEGNLVIHNNGQADNVFVVKGTGSSTLIMRVVVPKNQSVTVTRLPYATYNVTAEPWGYKSTFNPANNNASATIESVGQTCQVQFDGSLVGFNWLSGETRNVFSTGL